MLWKDRWEAAAGVAVDARAGGEDGRSVGGCMEMEATYLLCFALWQKIDPIGPVLYCVIVTVRGTSGRQREGTMKTALPNLA